MDGNGGAVALPKQQRAVGRKAHECTRHGNASGRRRDRPAKAQRSRCPVGADRCEAPSLVPLREAPGEAGVECLQYRIQAKVGTERRDWIGRALRCMCNVDAAADGNPRGTSGRTPQNLAPPMRTSFGHLMRAAISGRSAVTQSWTARAATKLT